MKEFYLQHPYLFMMNAIIIAFGLSLGGWFIGRGVMSVRGADQIVTVKGIAEKNVQADIAVWPLVIETSDNDLVAAYKKLTLATEKTREFLSKYGVDSSQAQISDFSVADARTNQYASPGAGADRYVIKQTLIVRSEEPEKILQASSHVGELSAAGVALSSRYGGPTFSFLALNTLKPQMIAEATARAREAAEQFAKDSQTSIGSIKRANQGVFQILPRDEVPGLEEGRQIEKKVRVVVTLDYYLNR